MKAEIQVLNGPCALCATLKLIAGGSHSSLRLVLDHKSSEDPGLARRSAHDNGS